MWLEEKLTNCGKPIKNIVFLAPINVTINPHKKFPIIAPIDTIAPIHDICSVESGPDVNGLWSDWSSGVAIDTHPVAHPKPTMIKLASICNKIRETFFVLENLKLFQCSQLRMKSHTQTIHLQLMQNIADLWTILLSQFLPFFTALFSQHLFIV